MTGNITPETDAELYPMNGVDIVWPDFARKLERERDGAREKYDLEAVEHMLATNKLCNEREILRLDAQKEAEHHDRMVRELERIYTERDDALNQIQGWENKWKVAVDMAAIAENKVSNLEDQLDLAMKVIKRLEANQP